MGSCVSDQSKQSKKTIYFGYGSNLWLYQMSQRCPTSTYLGVARLNGYKWIINDRGYANVVEAKEDDEAKKEKDEDFENEVYGLVYSLLPKDESRLDKNEGVPIAYTKEDLECEFWESDEKKDHGRVNVTKPPTETKKMLVYIDRNRTTEDKPKKEYIYRMNMGIKDAVEMGVPQQYVDDVMRKFIPAPDDDEDSGKGAERTEQKEKGSVEQFALKQANNFVDEN